jgi:hypothetical protein
MSADAEKLATFECSLTRCAELLGDITPMVAATFYEAHPEARALFEAHYAGAKGHLEGEMVEQALYCLMNWFSAPREIEIVVLSTFPHHVETLGTTPEQFSGFVDAVCRVIASTVPAGASQELAVLVELEEAFHALATKSRKLLRVQG